MSNKYRLYLREGEHVCPWTIASWLAYVTRESGVSNERATELGRLNIEVFLELEKDHPAEIALAVRLTNTLKCPTCGHIDVERTQSELTGTLPEGDYLECNNCGERWDHS